MKIAGLALPYTPRGDYIPDIMVRHRGKFGSVADGGFSTLIPQSKWSQRKQENHFMWFLNLVEASRLKDMHKDDLGYSCKHGTSS